MYKECTFVLYFQQQFTHVSIWPLVIFLPPTSTSYSLSLPLCRSPCSWVISCTSNYFTLGNQNIFLFCFYSRYVAIMDRKSSRFFHIMSCAKLKSAGPVRSLLYFGASVFFREETRFGSLPISIPSFCESTGYYDCQSFSNIKAHLKRLNANLISYMKQSWFTFPELFFLSLQTTTQRTPHTPPV